MSNVKVLNSKITLMQVLEYSVKTKFKNRVKFMGRDVLVKVDIIERKTFDRVEKKIKNTYYQIIAKTYSYPQYYPYTKDKKGNKQRKVKHEYSHIIELVDLKLTSPFRYRLGSQKKWVASPPKSMVKSVSLSERHKIRNQVEKKFKTVKEQNTEYTKIINKRRSTGKYLDVGDYNSRELGINGDFYFRLQGILNRFGALYGRSYYTEIPINVNFPFFPKHLHRVMNYLVQKGIVKWN